MRANWANVVLIGLLANLVVAAPAEAAPKCFGKRATIVGTNGDDRLAGTRGRDVIHARGGVDVVRGRGGNDLICLGRGGDAPEEHEVARGGSGSDKIKGGPGADFIHGGRGRDRLRGGAGTDILRGGGHADLLRDTSAPNVVRQELRGGWGHDTLVGGDWWETMIDGDGRDTIFSGGGADSIELRNDDDSDMVDAGEHGDELVVSGAQEAEASLVVDLDNGFVDGPGRARDEVSDVEHVDGTCAPCDVTGSANANNIMVAGDGPHSIAGLDGNDDVWVRWSLGGVHVEGGEGDDVLETADHGDEVVGGPGDDRIVAREGSNLVDGGDGSDTAAYITAVEVDLAAGTAASRDSAHVQDSLISIENVWGGRGDDRLHGGDEDNVILGGWPPELGRLDFSGDDFLDGRGGFDTLDGLNGTDTCVNGEDVRNCENDGEPGEAAPTCSGREATTTEGDDDGQRHRANR